LPTIDVLGLNDEHIAHATSIRQVPAGHEKTTANTCSEPDVIILYDGLSGAAWRRAEYDALGATTILIPAVIDMAKQPRLFQDYEIRAVQIAPGWWFNLLVRRDAAQVIARTQAVAN
jgi:hypothetical protein